MCFLKDHGISHLTSKYGDEREGWRKKPPKISTIQATAHSFLAQADSIQIKMAFFPSQN